MSDALKTVMLVRVDGEQNNNKFYAVSLLADNTVLNRWGRVGATGQSQRLSGGEQVFERTVAAKKRKGYVEVPVIADTVEGQATTQLRDIAKSTLIREGALNPTLEDLVERLVRINRHEILETSGGLIKVNTDGRIATPLGLIQLSAIREAEQLLPQLQAAQGGKRIQLAERYLSLIPQRVPKVKVWVEDELNDAAAFSQQQTFLTQLRDSLEFYSAQAAQATATADVDDLADIQARYKDLFRFNVDMLDENSREWHQIEKLYDGSRNTRHTSNQLRLKRIFTLQDGLGAETYEAVRKRLGNEQLLWHGTRAFNVLSILRKGLFVPPTSGSGIQIQGRMFGNGIYLSDQSTKSLNYSYGYWGGGNREDNCFMFLTKTAMGHEFRPRYWNTDSYRKATEGTGLSGKRYNSISVKGGTCNVLNNEIIVWDETQVSLRYLVEFDR